MNQRRLFQRKIIFFALICALLFPLFALSQPATTKSAGGQLAQLRAKYKLSEADLGQIDPTSVSMKLATFGLQGAATNLLWSRAIRYKEREDWTNFDATLEQITKLQPHFVEVWDFQGHNVAFNISVEFDDYRDKYRHIIKGFNLLKQGIRYNEKEARLLRRLADYIGLKIGRSDEKKYFRPLFAADRDYHAPPRDQNPLTGTRYEDRPENLTDNWLISKWWYQQAEDLIDSGVAAMSTMNPFLVHSEPPMQQMQYARALEEDGHFNDEMRDAWKQAAREWLAYGLRPILTSLGFEVKLEDVDRLKQSATKPIKISWLWNRDFLKNSASSVWPNSPRKTEKPWIKNQQTATPRKPSWQVRRSEKQSSRWKMSPERPISNSEAKRSNLPKNTSTTQPVTVWPISTRT